VSEARQPQALTVGDHRGHLRGVVLFVLQLPGDKESRDGEQPEVLVRDPIGPQLGRARGEQRLWIGSECDGPRPGRELAVEPLSVLDLEQLDQRARFDQGTGSDNQLPSGELRQNVVPYCRRQPPRPVAVRADPGQSGDFCSSRDRTADTDQIHVHLHHDSFEGSHVGYHAKEVRFHDRHAKLLLELSNERVARILAPLRLSAREKKDIRRLLLAHEQHLS
jgi:hypothetical protein